MHTPDRRWYPIEIEASSRSRFPEWESALDEVLDAYFEDGETRDEAEPEAEADAKSEAEADAEPEAKSGTKPEAKADAKREADGDE